MSSEHFGQLAWQFKPHFALTAPYRQALRLSGKIGEIADCAGNQRIKLVNATVYRPLTAQVGPERQAMAAISPLHIAGIFSVAERLSAAC
jgi:hypothetical protein